MRSLTHIALALAVATAGLTTSTAAAAVAISDPEALYKEGQEAFAAGDNKTAVDRWTRSREASGDPLVLYNIGQAYRAWYDESADPRHLEKARVALDELRGVLEEDETLGDPEEVADMIAEIDEKLAAVAPATEEPEDEEVEGPVEQTGPEVSDRRPKLKIAGIATMAVGGALLVTGVIVGGVFAARGSSLTGELDALYDIGAPESEIQAKRDKGASANLAAGLGFGLLGGLGAGAVAAGAVLYTRGVKREREGVAALRIAPTLGGLSVSGRF